LRKGKNHSFKSKLWNYSEGIAYNYVQKTLP